MTMKILNVLEVEMNLHKCPHTRHATESKYKMKQLNPFHGGLLKPSSSNIRSLYLSCLCWHVANPWCETHGKAYINQPPHVSLSHVFPYVTYTEKKNTLDICTISDSGKGLRPKASRQALRNM